MNQELRQEVLNYLNEAEIDSFADSWSVLGEIFEKYLKPEFIFYFEKEDLLEEVNLVYGSARAYSLKQDQYFSQLKTFAYEKLDGESQILPRIPMPLLKLDLVSSLVLPIYYTETSRGVWIISSPRDKKKYASKDLRFLEDVFTCSMGLMETLKLKRIVHLYQKEQRLTSRLHKLLDSNYELAPFLKYLIEIIEETMFSRIVCFLMYDEISGHYNLEAGNAEGCEFWAAQEDFFKTLALQSETQGVFSKTYSGKHFRGEKYGLDRLETALVVPMKFYERQLGVFVLLNKKEQLNFTDLDVKMMQAIVRHSKGVICREKEKDSIVSIFKKFVSDKIVGEILENPTKSILREERKFLTVLFVDLNNFTALSEKNSPAKVIVQLNEFLAAMTQLVFEYGGTLDKYIGDEIMALFGSPVSMEQHAHRAVECALSMQRKMEELGIRWKSEGREVLSASIGICTGNAVVGTIGCDQYVDYTAIGDTVNIASRITQAAPAGVILISQSTMDLMNDVVVIRKQEELRLKGKDSSVMVCELERLKHEDEINNLLAEADDTARVKIMQVMSNFMAYEKSDVAVNFVREGSAKVRQQALDTITKRNRESDIELLLELAGNEPDLAFRGQMLDAVSKISGDAVIALLQDYLRDIEPAVQIRIINSLGYEGDAENKKLLLPLLSDVSNEVRASVAHAIYRYGDSSVLEILYEMVQSRELAMKFSAIQVLGKIGTPQAIRPLVQLLATKPNQELSIAIARALGSLNQKKSLQYLAYLVESDSYLHEWRAYVSSRQDQTYELKIQAYRRAINSMNPYVAYASLIALGSEGLTGLDSDLLELLRSANPITQLEVMKTLRNCPNSRVIPIYIDLLEPSENTDTVVIGQILKEIGSRKLGQFVEILHKFLYHTDPDIQMDSAQALSEIGKSSSVDQLLKVYYETEHANLKATIVRSLGSFHSRRILPILLEGLRSPIARIRANAIDSLVKKDYQEAVPMIQPLMNDENNRVRANAALALFRFGQKDTYFFLDQMLSSDDKWMRLSAIWTLSEIGGEQSHEIIMKHLNDSDYDVKLRAILSINKLDKNMLNLFVEMMEAS